MSTALNKIAGVTAPVDRKTYFGVGAGLMALKYAVDAGLIYAFTGAWVSPLVYLMPIASLRLKVLEGAPGMLTLFLALWTLPFVWVGTSMSVRRARDAGLPAFVGLGFLWPLLNFFIMATLSMAPSRPLRARTGALQGEERVVWSALVGVGAGTALSLSMVLFSVFVVGQYGAGLFVATPFVMGAVSAFLFNLRRPLGLFPNVTLAVVTVGVTSGTLMLFALEGALCLAMAAPLGLILAGMGVILGRQLAALELRRPILGSIVLLPALIGLEPPPGEAILHEVRSEIVVDAAPEVVWGKLAEWPELKLPDPPQWFFQQGIAYPMRAHIEGRGVGAIRYCEFSTGPFVEPITVWDEPYHLAFDVVESPPTMHEWSPYEKVFAPHLDGILQSRHGEFRLEPMEGGKTRLIGTTWYSFDMAPEAYWALWSDAAIHAIHMRVLRYVGILAEEEARG